MKRLLLLPFLIVSILIAGCSDADIVSHNISKEADMFRVNRRVVFYNGITADYMLLIEGKCSLGNSDPTGQLSVTCKVGDDKFKKHFLGLSDNVTYFVEQLEPNNVDSYHYKVIFKPQTIIPDIELKAQ